MSTPTIDTFIAALAELRDAQAKAWAHYDADIAPTLAAYQAKAAGRIGCPADCEAERAAYATACTAALARLDAAVRPFRAACDAVHPDRLNVD